MYTCDGEIRYIHTLSEVSDVNTVVRSINTEKEEDSIPAVKSMYKPENDCEVILSADDERRVILFSLSPPTI